MNQSLRTYQSENELKAPYKGHNFGRFNHLTTKGWEDSVEICSTLLFKIASEYILPVISAASRQFSELANRKPSMHNKDNPIVEVWKSHRNYLAKHSTELEDFRLADYLANIFCPGPFYYYILDSATQSFDIVSDSIISVLGLLPGDFTIDAFLERLHPEDLDFFIRCEDVVGHFLTKVVGSELITKYKVSFCLRKRITDGSYNLFLMQSIAIKTTDDGALVKVLGTQTNINHITTENNKKISFIGLEGNPSFLEMDVFDDNVFENFTPYDYSSRVYQFTNRELQILKLLARGSSTEDIAVKLNLSTQTVNTHRKNMLRKSGAKNSLEMVAQAIRNGQC